MLALQGLPQADMRTGQPREPRAVEWVDIPQPNPADAECVAAMTALP